MIRLARIAEQTLPRLRIFHEGVQTCEERHDHSMDAVAVALSKHVRFDDRD